MNDPHVTYVSGGMLEHLNMPTVALGGIQKIRQVADVDRGTVAGAEIHTWHTSTLRHPTRALFGWYARRWLARHPLRYTVQIFRADGQGWREVAAPVTVR